MSLRRFDASEAWIALSEETRRAIGEAALLLQVSTEAQMLAIDKPPLPAGRRWERAEQIAWQRFATIPIDPDLYPGGPDLAALGIQACRVCGCTNEMACEGGCSWVEDDLCSECVGKSE